MREWTDEELELWVLGLLPDAARAELEVEAFTDEALYARMSVAADDLLGDFAAGRLDDDRAGRLRHGLLATDEGRRRLTIVRRLGAARPKRRRIPWIAAAAALGLLALSTLIFRLPRPVTTTETPVRTAPPSASASRGVAHLRLQPGLERSATRDGGELVLSDERDVELVAPLPRPHPAHCCDAEIQTPEGVILHRLERPRYSGGMFLVSVPASELPPRDLVLLLKAADTPVEVYGFRVRRRSH